MSQASGPNPAAPISADRSVLGIDAAWTLTEPSGVALLVKQDAEWRLACAEANYDAFIVNPAAGPAVTTDAFPDAASLIDAAGRRSGRSPDLVAVDMPLARSPITRRRKSDNAVSRAYGARHCSTHTPSSLRPGPISDRLRHEFAASGYELGTLDCAAPALVEVYPHPALVELAGASRRLPYKAGKARQYWPKLNPAERREQLFATWAQIIGLLEQEVVGVAAQFEMPPPHATGRELKAFEDRLDAVVCAWVGICILEGEAIPYGDDDSAIWIPKPRHLKPGDVAP